MCGPQADTPYPCRVSSARVVTWWVFRADTQQPLLLGAVVP